MLAMNRQQRRAFAAQNRRSTKSLTRVNGDVSIEVLHPTKGYRKVSQRRIQAQALMAAMPGMMMALANTAR